MIGHVGQVRLSQVKLGQHNSYLIYSLLVKSSIYLQNSIHYSNHLNTRPLFRCLQKNRTNFPHLTTSLAQYSDPHFKFKINQNIDIYSSASFFQLGNFKTTDLKLNVVFEIDISNSRFFVVQSLGQLTARVKE